MRGKVDLVVQCRPGAGITPAYAGKSGSLQSGSRMNGDHPRVCGEKSSWAFWAMATAGSPPRMRGKAPHSFDALLVGGITPAYAGKSGRANLHHRFLGDHPRTCGEKQHRGDVARVGPGITPAHAGKRALSLMLSLTTWDHPRTCGEKQHRGDVARVGPGITPAHAGKRALSLMLSLTTWDHPRVCGEKFFAIAASLIF